MNTDEGLYNRRFGQVLLTNRQIAEFEVEALNLSPGENVIEIGPGKGALTEIILRHGVNITCIEPDHRFVEFISSRFKEYTENGKLNMVKGNFLEQEIKGGGVKIIGNIPYHISSSIVFRLSEIEFDLAVLMVQKDFALRMIAEPGSAQYSRLSVNCAYWFDVELLKVVGKENFEPEPKVDSAVITLKRKEIESDVDPHELDIVLKTLFSKRRKKVGTVYKNCPSDFKDKRPEELTLHEFISLTKSLSFQT